MNKQQIKAELRRSACEDKNPYDECIFTAFEEVCKWKDIGNEYLASVSAEEVRTFFLLVAEAL